MNKPTPSAQPNDPSFSSSDNQHPENTTTPRFPLPTWEDFPQLPEQFTRVFTPGNVLFFSSFPFCYRAYRDYHKYSQMIVQARVASASSSTAVPDNKLGMMVASRALGIATRGSVGLFALTGSCIFFCNGWSSLSDAVQATQRWAQSRRQRLITLLGLQDKHNQDPDYIETKHMTDEQALNYLAKKYFVSQEEGEEEEPRTAR